MSDDKKTIIQRVPNILSTTRLGLGLVMPIAFIFIGAFGKVVYYVFGNLTDAVDGFIARNFNAKSDYGKVVDPIADKFFNLMALASAAVFINPFLVGILVAEITIATTTMKHGMHNVKQKGVNRRVYKSINTDDMNFCEKIKAYARAYIGKASVYVDSVKGLNVSRFGRKKAIVMVLAILSAFLTPIFPTLTTITATLIATATLAELPVISKYILEYRRELGKTSDFDDKWLSRLNTLDKGCDKLDEVLNKTIVEPIKKVVGLVINTKGNKKCNGSNQEANSQDSIEQSEVSEDTNNFEEPTNEIINDVLVPQKLDNKNVSNGGAINYYSGPQCYFPFTLYNELPFEEDLGPTKIKRI